LAVTPVVRVAKERSAYSKSQLIRSLFEIAAISRAGKFCVHPGRFLSPTILTYSPQPPAPQSQRRQSCYKVWGLPGEAAERGGSNAATNIYKVVARRPLVTPSIPTQVNIVTYPDEGFYQGAYRIRLSGSGGGLPSSMAGFSVGSHDRSHEL